MPSLQPFGDFRGVDIRASERCIEAIKGFESFRGEAYQDVCGVWTLGYGDTLQARPGATCTEAEAADWLLGFVAEIELDIKCYIHVPTTQGQWDALVDFSYNLGSSILGLRHMTLRDKLNAKDYAGAAAEFPKWDHADGKVLADLQRRRRTEQEWFLQDA